MKTINVPEGISVEIEKSVVTVKGPKGALTRSFSDPRHDAKIKIEKTANEISVSATDEKRKSLAMVGTIASHIKNMITGAKSGYKYKMKIHYIHFPITVEVKGKHVMIKNFLGERGIRKASIVGNTKLEVKKDDIFLTGIDKESLGQTAANIENACKLDRRDRRIFLDGIYMAGHEVGA